MTQEELDQIVIEHNKWRLDPILGKRANLSKANLSGTNLSGANLSGANLYGADLSRADLSGADLSGANLSGANLSEADLSGADLSGADLSGANLSGADLFQVYLFGADLSEANLSGANLSGADLFQVYLFGADLSGAIFNNTTYGEGVPITKIPVQINSLRWNVIIFDTHMKIGCQLHSFEEWSRFSDEEISKMHTEALDFWRQHKVMLLEIIKTTRGYGYVC